jgi:D-3-phosphoglycerate dehydrogenase
VLLASPRLGRIVPQLREMLPLDIELLFPKTRTDEELINLVSDVEVIVCVRLSAEVARAAKKLQLIQKTGAGVDAIPFTVLGDETFVANTSGANPVPLAEGAVALLLALAKQIVQRHKSFQRGHIDRGQGIEVRGKKVGIIGFGHIGREVARLLQGFEMRILALKRHPDDSLKIQLGLDFLGGPKGFDFLLQESDFVVVTVPLTPETHGMIGERELRLMKQTAFIINIARAAIIQEEPLFRALKERWIAGAALDVWWLPHWWDPTWNRNGKSPRYPFWELPNVIATPHSIGSSDTRSDEALRIIAENITRITKGQPPINQVNKTLQY